MKFITLILTVIQNRKEVDYMNKDYSFRIAHNDKCFSGKVKYDVSEGINFIERNQSDEGFFELYFGYVMLCISLCTKRAECLIGFCPFESWEFRELILPTSYKSELYIENDIASKDLKIEYYVDDWYTYYDKNKNVLCMGDLNVHDNDEAVEFCTDIVAVLEDGKYLKAIWIKNMEFEGGRPF